MNISIYTAYLLFMPTTMRQSISAKSSDESNVEDKLCISSTTWLICHISNSQLLAIVVMLHSNKAVRTKAPPVHQAIWWASHACMFRHICFGRSAPLRGRLQFKLAKQACSHYQPLRFQRESYGTCPFYGNAYVYTTMCKQHLGLDEHAQFSTIASRNSHLLPIYNRA